MFGVCWCPVFGTWLSIAVQHISAGLAAKTTHIYHPTVSVGLPPPDFSRGCRPGVSRVWSHLKVNWGRDRSMLTWVCGRIQLLKDLSFPSVPRWAFLAWPFASPRCVSQVDSEVEIRLSCNLITEVIFLCLCHVLLAKS